MENTKIALENYRRFGQEFLDRHLKAGLQAMLVDATFSAEI